MNPGVVITLVVWLFFVAWLICEIVGAHQERRQMERLRVVGDRQWAEAERQSTLDMWDDTMDQLGISSPLADETRVARLERQFELPCAPDPRWRL